MAGPLALAALISAGPLALAALISAGPLALATLISAVATAQAPRPRVVVVPFRGPEAGRLTGALEANLSEQSSVELVPFSEVRRIAQQFGYRIGSLGSSDYIEIARELRVSAYVSGQVRRERRSWHLAVSVRSASDGTIVGTEAWGGRTVSALGAIRRSGYDRLGASLAVTQPPAVAGRPEPHGTRPGETTERTNGTAQTQHGSTRRDGGAWYEPQDEDDEDEDEENGPDDGVSGGQRATWLDARLFVGAMSRALDAFAQVRNGVPGNVRDPGLDPNAILTEHRQYSSSPAHLEGGVAVEFYPGALLRHQVLPRLGLTAGYYRSLLLSSQGCTQLRAPGAACAAGASIDLPSSESEVFVGALGRFRLGEAAHPTEIGAEVALGYFAFDIDLAALERLARTDVIPPMQYAYISAGGSVSYAFDATYLIAEAGAQYRIGLSIGQPAKDIWGVETGEPSGFELSGRLRSYANYLFEGAYLELEAEYFRFETAFSGQTVCIELDSVGNCIDNDLGPWEAWPTDAESRLVGGIAEPVVDSYFRLGVAFGLSLR